MQQDGRPDQGSDNELALIVGQIRRRLSVTAVKAQVGCLLSRVHQVGPGNKQLAKKRQWAIKEDERMRQERYSQWMRKIEGVNSLLSFLPLELDSLLDLDELLDLDF